jgi:hypothetical protein
MRRLKVDKKLVTRKMSVAFAVAIALVFVSNVALADSAYEWAYWDVSPSAGANSEPAGVYPEQVASLTISLQSKCALGLMAVSC